MKKSFRSLFAILFVFVSILFVSACGSTRVKYDLSQMSEVAVQGVVQQMQSSSTVSKYVDKNIKIKAKLEGYDDYEYITGVGVQAECCNWQIKVRFKDESIKPVYDKKKVFTGTYKKEKVSGRTNYYLEIIEVK